MKFVTWNINGGYGLNPDNTHQFLGYENLDYFIHKLKQIDADIVCLQEVHVNTERSQAQEIAKTLDYSAVFESVASESHIDPRFQLANAILAKQDIDVTHSITLPQPQFPLELPILASGERARIHDKVLQIVQINELMVSNTHLLPLHILGARWDNADGRNFATSIADVLKAELRTPLVLCGDFNFPNINDLMSDLIASFKLTDALPNEPSLPGFDLRIDYILASDELKVRSSEIFPCYTDHFPCVVSLTA